MKAEKRVRLQKHNGAFVVLGLWGACKLPGNGAKTQAPKRDPDTLHRN